MFDRGPGSAKSPAWGMVVGTAVMIGCVLMIGIGVWALAAERIAITTEGVSCSAIGKAPWKMRWDEIQGVRLKADPGTHTMQYKISLGSAKGDKVISTTFLPVGGRELAREISRRSVCR